MAIVKDHITNFKRIEKKYLLSSEQYLNLMSAAAEHLRPDEYGESVVCNIYYDTNNNDLIRRSIEHPVYKEKLRLRSYGIPDIDSTVFLEIKKKFDKVVYKRRAAMTLQQAEDFILGKSEPPISNPNTLRELKFFLRRYDLHPALYLAYDRQSFYCADDDTLRITFDRRIRSRHNELSLSNGDRGEFLFSEDVRLMEVKAAGALPLWLVHILSELKIHPVSFSKYGRIHTKYLLDLRR